MKYFKNENEYGNMKLENETYTGILLKTGDEGYRYYSSSNSSTSSTSSTSSGGSGTSSSSSPSGSSSNSSGTSNSVSNSGSSSVGSYDCSYCLDTGVLNGSACPHCINIEWGCASSSSSDGLITLNITATCGNSGNMTVELYGEGSTGTIVSQSASSDRVEASGQITAGKYTIVVWAYSNTGALRSKEEIIVVKNVNSNSASDYNCAYCKNTGLVADKNVCTYCEEGNAYITPIRFAHNYSKQPSGYEMDFAALCEGGWNMRLDLHKEDNSWQAPSKCVSALGVANTYYPLGEGTYIIEAKAITENGFTRTQKETIEITEAGAHPVYPVGFSYTVNSYDKDNETCNVTMVARYKDAPGTYLDIVSVDGSTEEVVASAYRDGSLVVMNEDMLIGDYVAKTKKNFVNWEQANEPVEFNVDAQEVNLTLAVTNKSFDETTEKYCIGVSICASSGNYLNNLMVVLYDENGEELLDTSEENNCEFYVDEGSYRLKAESGCPGITYFYGERYVQFAVEDSSVGHELPLTDIPEDSAPGGGGGSTGGNDTTDDTTTPEVEDISDNERKFLLLYTGPNLEKGGSYPDFADGIDAESEGNGGEVNEVADDIAQLLECGATDYVILTAESFNYRNFPGCEHKDEEGYACGECEACKSQQILSVINEEDAKTPNTTWYNKLKEGLGFEVFDEIEKGIVESANTIIKQFNKYGMYNYNDYANAVISLADKLYKRDKNCRLWIGLPHILKYCYFLATEYDGIYKDFMESIRINNDTNEARSFWNNVVGFYYGTEDIPAGYSDFDVVTENTENLNLVERANTIDFNNTVVKNMRNVKDWINKNYNNKKLLWIPYYRDTYADTDSDGTFDSQTYIPERVGNVINNTNIFDYVILQSSHYFFENCEHVVPLVAECVKKQRCVYYEYDKTEEAGTFKRKKNETGEDAAPVVVGGQYYSNDVKHAIIGVEMEINSEINGKYNDYVDNFKKFITGEENTEKVPIAFYVDDRNSFAANNYAVKNYVVEFFKNGGLPA